MRFYTSNIRPHWPFERQAAAFDRACPGWRRHSVYMDDLPPRKRKSHGPEDLEARAMVLRPSVRRGTDPLHVASPAVLAWTLSDFLAVLGSLSAKGMPLVLLDTGTTIQPDASPTEIAEAGKLFEQSCRRRKGEPGERGGDVSGRVRSEAAQSRCETIRERWALPSMEHPTAALLAEADVSKPTAIKWLGIRSEVQRRYRAGRVVAESNRRRGDHGHAG